MVRPELAVGLRLWRPIGINSIYGNEIGGDLSKLARTRFGSVVLSAIWGSGYCTDEWVIAASESHRRGGFICFCEDRIPELWTYFQITRINSGGKSAMVKPFAGDVDELLLKYRLYSRNNFRSHPLLAQLKAPV